MPEPEFIQLQRAFTRHLRDPARVPAPALPEAGLEIYRHAVFFNIERFMRDNFPRVAEVLAPAVWTALIRDYLVRHQSHTPLFVELLNEFLDYLRHERAVAEDPPWLFELAHFDWLENALASDQRVVERPSTAPPADLLAHSLRLNPVHRLERYEYPVHAIAPAFMPAGRPPRPTRLLAFRDLAGEFAVLDLNDVTVDLFEGVAGGRPARAVLADIALRLAHPEPAKVESGGADILQRWWALGLVVGALDVEATTSGKNS